MPLELMPAFGKLNGNRVGGPLLGRLVERDFRMAPGSRTTWRI